MRGNLQSIWLILAILVAAGMAISWYFYFSKATNFAWWHLVGLGLTVLFLVLIWLWPGARQPKGPPL
jgi:hypothetical protein